MFISIWKLESDRSYIAAKLSQQVWHTARWLSAEWSDCEFDTLGKRLPDMQVESGKSKLEFRILKQQKMRCRAMFRKNANTAL